MKKNKKIALALAAGTAVLAAGTLIANHTKFKKNKSLEVS